MASLEFGSAKAARGQKSWGQLRVREGKKSVRLPVVVIHGAAAGEHAVVLANQHGGEVNGIESIRRFAEEVDHDGQADRFLPLPHAQLAPRLLPALRLRAA